MTFKFSRHNLLTGEITIGEFNPSHHACFVDPKGESPRLIERVVSELIAKWNRQQPKNWIYIRI